MKQFIINLKNKMKKRNNQKLTLPIIKEKEEIHLGILNLKELMNYFDDFTFH